MLFVFYLMQNKKGGFKIKCSLQNFYCCCITFGIKYDLVLIHMNYCYCYKLLSVNCYQPLQI